MTDDVRTMQTPVVPIYEAGDYERQVRQAVALLGEGKVVVLPTETVYGAAALLRKPEALARLRALRPPGDESAPKPFVPHLAARAGASAFLGPVGDLGRRMMKKLWPGPVALVFDVPADRRREVAAGFNLPETDLYDGPSVTLRCPDHVVAEDVLAGAEEAGGPVVAVRAGISTNQPAQRAQLVAEELDGRVDLILDAGPSRYSKPSTIVRVKDGSYEIVRAGVYDERIIERLMRTTILFVCSGNTCRSPMAEALARRLLAEKLHVAENGLEGKGISVMSAGSFAMPGSRATPQAVDALRDLGVDLSHHRSKPLSVELIHQADHIFTMSQAHAQAVRALVPSASDKIDTLAPGRDIEDPIGGDVTLYQELAGELRGLIEKRLDETVLP